MTQETFCQYCGKKFYAQRNSAKFCYETPCRQRHKRMKIQGFDNEFERVLLNSLMDIKELREAKFNDSHSGDMLLETMTSIDAIQHELNKMVAYIGTIETQQANTWYQCQECGQKTFGKVETCDFCGSSDWKAIRV